MPLNPVPLNPVPLNPGSLIPETLARRAADHPDRRALVFVDDHGTETATLTYAALRRRALAVAAAVAGVCRPGDRAVLAFPPGLEFVVAFLGCLEAGVIAVPVNPPSRPDRVPRATAGIVTDCAPSAVLTVDGFAGEQGLAPHLPRITVDLRGDPGESLADPHPAAAGTVAFLQYTSGSTSAPKGVMVTHGNLAANQDMIRRAFGHDESSTFVGWAPLFHDQGLIGNVLQPLHVGTTSVLMSPASFIRRPLLWPSMISRYGAHTSGGPNFAFDACSARAAAAPGELEGLDLSSWRVAFDGAEPIRADTLRRFATTFAPYGFEARALFPCYGLAEATLFVTGSGRGRGPRTLTVDADELAAGALRPVAPGCGSDLVGSGEVPRGQVEIVDPDTGHPCLAGRVGEIRVTGEHVAAGYWRRGAASVETFGPGGTPTLRTGDLGVILDGELYVVGRRKDMIIVRGRNLYPHDVEHTVVTAHPSLRPGGCAAVGVPGPDGERLVVVAEVGRDAHPEPDAVTAAVRAAVVAEHRTALSALLLVPAGALGKTSSGKIMRSAARTRYLDGGFTAWTAQPDEPLEAVR